MKYALQTMREKNLSHTLNRTFIIGRMRTLFIKLVVGISEMSDLDILLDDVTHSKSQIQPGRKYKRDKKKGKLRKHMRNRKAMPT